MPDPLSPAATPAAGAPAGMGAPITVRDYIAQQAAGLNIPPELALAIVHQESRGKQSATSPKGARGFMQLMPQTANGLGVNADDPFENISGGLRYFKQQLDAHGGDVRLALAAYNAGPGAIRDGQVPDIPETQDYVRSVLGYWQNGIPLDQEDIAAQHEQVAPHVATPPPAAATAGMLPPSTMEAPTRPEPQPGFFESFVVDPIRGFGKAATETVADAGRLVEKTGLRLPDIPKGDTTARTAGESVGAFAERAAEFAAPGNLITKATRSTRMTAALIRAGVTPARARYAAIAAESASQAAAAAAISLFHGEDPTAAATISAAAPVVGELVTSMGPSIRKAAVTRMARFMERGMPGHITPETERQLAQAASDFIDLPLQRTWRQTARLTRAGRESAGKSLEAGLAGPLGDTPVPIGPVIQSLDDLEQDALHLIPVRDPKTGLATGQYRTKAYDEVIPRAVNELKSYLADYVDAYGTHMPARELHDVKAVWWDAIYPKKEGAQPVPSLAELLTTAQKTARMKGAAAIAKVLETDAPQLAQLDEAVSHAARLDQFVKRLSSKARASKLATPEGRRLVSAAGGGVGVAVGSAVGHPFVGLQVGYATGRLLVRAIESPKWRLLPIATRRKLADALAAGNVTVQRQILAPIVAAATAKEDNLLDEDNQARLRSSSASAAR